MQKFHKQSKNSNSNMQDMIKVKNSNSFYDYKPNMKNSPSSIQLSQPLINIIPNSPALPVMSTPATAPPQYSLYLDQNRRNLPATNSAGTIVSSTNSQTPFAQKFQEYQNKTSNSNLNRNNNNNKMVHQNQAHNNQNLQNRNNQVYNNHFSQNSRYPSSTSSKTQRLQIFSCGGLIFLWHLVYMFAMILNIFYLYFRPEKVISITCILEIGCSISLITGLFLQNHCLMMPMLFNYVSQFLFNVYLVTTEIIRSTNESGTLSPSLDLRTQLIRALNKPELKYFRNGVLDFITSSEMTTWQKSGTSDAYVMQPASKVLNQPELDIRVCAPWPGLYIVAASLFCLYFLVMITALVAYVCLTPQKGELRKKSLRIQGSFL